ncbi:MAG: hypothetical protein AMJ91_07415 [candidate division Zixibacteria bacterium SM23_73_3]|nr:MAG: hypothetical protein AMJ91_07415 [candidate division Zixibacteria bacterium SM23_73_3]
MDKRLKEIQKSKGKKQNCSLKLKFKENKDVGLRGNFEFLIAWLNFSFCIFNFLKVRILLFDLPAVWYNLDYPDHQ